MSEDKTDLEKCTPVTIRFNGHKVTVSVPEFTSLADLLDATGAKMLRVVTPMNRFFNKNGVEIVEPDPIIGPWQQRESGYAGRKRFLSCSGWYELCDPDKNKLNDFLEKYQLKN